MRSLFIVIDLALDLYLWAIIIAAVLSWLMAFNVLNARSPFVYQISDFFQRITEPLFRRIRRFVPSLGGVDLSPLVVIFLIVFIRSLMREYGPL